MKREKYRTFVAERPWLIHLFSRFYFENKPPGQQDCGLERKAEMWATENVSHLTERPLENLDQTASCWSAESIPVGKISIGPGQRRLITATIIENFYLIGDKDSSRYFRPEDFRPHFVNLWRGAPVRKLIDDYSALGFICPRAIVKRIDASMSPLCRSVSIDVYKLPEVRIPKPLPVHW